MAPSDKHPGQIVPASSSPVLYDQTNNLAEQGIVSQDFASATDASLDSQAADDFVVPGGVTWQIDGVEVLGCWSPPGSAAGVNVFFYSDAGGRPGALVASRLSITPSSSEFSEWCLSIPLTSGAYVLDVSPVALPPGTYWLSVQAQQTGSGWWFWIERTLQSGSEAVWQNPGNGFGVGCTTWQIVQNCLPPECGVCGGFPDLLFRLTGTIASSSSTSNDDFAAAYEIPGASACSGSATEATCTGSTLGATAQPGEPSPVGVSGGHSIWYRWVAPSTGVFAFDTNGSAAPNTVIGVYRGSSFPLTFVDDNNDAGVGSASIATFAATEGTTYHVLVDVYPTAATGDTVLHLTSVDPCPFLEPGGGGPWDGVHIRGTPGNDELVGTDGVDVLCGFGGEDLLVGGLDNDVLLGGKGTDKLRGSPGNDLFDGGPGSDLADFSFSKKRVTVNLGKGTASGEGTDELMGVEDAFGSRYNDKLVGSAGANSLWGFDGVDNLFGLAGDDYLDGGDGNDNLYGGPGNDSCIQGKGSGKLSSC